MNIDVDVTGTYADTATFLYSLTRFPKILSLVGAQMHPGAPPAGASPTASPTVSTNLKLVAFIFHDDGTDATDAAGSPAAATAVAQSPAAAPKEDLMGHTDVSSISAAGGRAERGAVAATKASNERIAVGQQRFSAGEKTNMKKLDKKQIPQFAALCILSAGVFGYFVIKVVTPSPAAAGTRAPQPAMPPVKAGPAAPLAAAPGGKPTAATPDAAGTTTVAAGTPGGTVPAPEDAAAPPPTPGMRDPFVVGYVDPKTIPAAPVSAPPAGPVQPNLPNQDKLIAKLNGLPPAPVSGPAAPALPPGLGGFASQAAVPSAPALPTAPAAPVWTVTGVLQSDVEKVAILRDGEARRIVRAGDFVDSVYRVDQCHPLRGRPAP